jgi:hypothetical protein
MERNFHDVVLIHLLNNDMRQGCERKAGNQKHEHAKRRVCIFDRHTGSFVGVGAFEETG